jgi:hypothetical protein
MPDLLGLLLVNVCFLAAGIGVTAVAGWWRGRRELGRSIGIAYLCGVATYGVSAQLLYVLGASLTRWQVLLVCALPACGAFAGAGAPRRPVWTRTRWSLLAVDLWFQPLWAFDSWTFWTPKAHALYALNGLDAGWFTSADLANKDYPILLPAIEAAGFRFTGYETSLLDLQSWFVFAAFIRAVYEIGATRARPVVLWAVLTMLVVAPSVADQLAAAEADIPEAVFFASAGMAAWIWLTERQKSALVVAVVLAAGAAATKVEGLPFTVSLFIALSFAAAARGFRRRGAEALVAGATSISVGLVPWRVWISEHGISNQASSGRVTGVTYLAQHLARAPIAAGYLAVKLLDPRAWLFIIPLAAIVGAAAARSGARRYLLFPVATVVLAYCGLILAYWSTPLPFHYHLATSARRVITGIVFLCAALTPLLSGEARLGDVLTGRRYPPES